MVRHSLARSGRSIAALLLVATMSSGCDNAPLASAATPTAAVTAPSMAAAPSDPTSPVPAPSTVDGQVALTASEAAALQAALEHPVTHANAVEVTLVRDLLRAAGVFEVVSEDQASLDRLLADERKAVGKVLEQQGGAPDWTLLEASTGAAPKGGIVLASTGSPSRSTQPIEAAPDPGATFLAAVLAMTAMVLHPETAEADETGRVRKVFDSITSSTIGDLDITLTEHVELDLERCPDPAGVAQGDLRLGMYAVATGMVNGVAREFEAGGTLAFTLRASANAHADLVEVDSSADGDIDATENQSPVGGFVAKGMRVTIPVTAGQPNAGAARAGGMPSGGGEDVSVATFLGSVLATRHGMSAASNWDSGACISLEFDPLSPRVAEGEKSTTVTVSGTSNRDKAEVKGDLTVTPSRGTFSPTKGALPLAIEVRLPDGKPSAVAKLETRSVRGVGRRTLEVFGGAQLVFDGQLVASGAGSVGPIGSGGGTRTIKFRLKSTEEVRPGEVPASGGPLVPLTLEWASFSWKGAGSALGQTGSQSGRTETIVHVDYSKEFWWGYLPEGEWIAGEGYLDPETMQLYLFLAAGSKWVGGGTYAIPPQTTCPTYRSKVTYQTFLLLDLNNSFGVTPGRCSSTFDGGDIKAKEQMSWTIKTLRADTP